MRLVRIASGKAAESATMLKAALDTYNTSQLAQRVRRQRTSTPAAPDAAFIDVPLPSNLLHASMALWGASLLPCCLLALKKPVFNFWLKKSQFSSGGRALAGLLPLVTSILQVRASRHTFVHHSGPWCQAGIKAVHCCLQINLNVS